MDVLLSTLGYYLVAGGVTFLCTSPADEPVFGIKAVAKDLLNCLIFWPIEVYRIIKEINQ